MDLVTNGNEIQNYVLKICVLGDGSVGKTSLVLQYCEHKFQENYIMTIGSNFAVKELNLDNGKINVKVQIWDLAGQQHFQFVRPPFYRGASGAIYVYDITRRESFENIKNWKKEADQVIAGKPFVLVGNKLDLADERVVSKSEGKKLADELGVEFFETSAKTGESVEQIFYTLVSKIIFKK